MTLAFVATACWKPSVDPIYTVTKFSDVVYGQGEVNGGGTFADLLLDLYVPNVEGQDRFPSVVTIHGGGFQVAARPTPRSWPTSSPSGATSWRPSTTA